MIKNINKSQKERGKKLKEKIENICSLQYCDNLYVNFGNTKNSFSPAFFHGSENVRLGYVVMTTVDDGKKRVLHTSDVQGPVTKKATDYIINQKPDILIIDGPPVDLLGWRFSYKNLGKASNNITNIIKKLKCEIILDHHLLRDLKYKERF